MENKINGLVYGAVLGDIVAKQYKGKDNSAEYRTKYKDVNIDEKDKDWTSISDRLIIIMDAITNSKEYINIFYLAEKFQEWQDKGLTELPPRSDRHIGMNLNFVLKQKDYLINPIKSSKKSYKLTGGDSATNDALACNSICGLLQKWHKNTILHTSITTYDSRCLVACITQSFIINCIFWRKKIDWMYLNPLCQKIIVSQKIKKTQNLIEYNNHWHIALNYKNFLMNYLEKPADDTPYLAFLKKLNIGNYNGNDNQSYSLLGMVLAMITAIDIQNEISNNRYPDVYYYKQRIQEVASCGGDSTSNCAIVGSIIGVLIGYEKLPREWLQKINNKIWLDLKIKIFSDCFMKSI